MTWKSCGYIAKSKSDKSAIIMISGRGNVKRYYVADLQEAIDALTGKIAYAKIYKRKS